MESPPWPAFLTGSGGERVGIRGDKQRLIWAYKLLFLDALFLGKADRVVFVDADQVRLETTQQPTHHTTTPQNPKKKNEIIETTEKQLLATRPRLLVSAWQ